ncbi:hypothetical protein GEMRC1_001790 [Eukaryota sp. GEM-RC1]
MSIPSATSVPRCWSPSTMPTPIGFEIKHQGLPRFNLSGVHGRDSLILNNDFYWFGGSVEIAEIDVIDLVYSTNADDRGFHRGATINFHDLGVLGGPGDVYVSGPNYWNILPDSHVKFLSSVNFISQDAVGTRLSHLNNQGHLDFPVEDITVNLAFNVRQDDVYTSAKGVTVFYDGSSISTGNYFLEPKSRLMLRYFNHEFEPSVTAVGDGNIHMSGWNYITSGGGHWGSRSVQFDGRWEVSTFSIKHLVTGFLVLLLSLI